MGCKLVLTTHALFAPFQHPQFQFEDFALTVSLVQESMRNGFFQHKNVVLQTGPGTIFHVLSDAEFDAQSSENKDAVRSGGLAMPDRFNSPLQWRLIIQMGTKFQLPPFSYVTEEAAHGEVKVAARTGLFMHVEKPLADHIYVQTGPGVLYMVLTAEDYTKKRREIAAAVMRQAAQQAAGGPGPRLIVPPGAGKRD